MASAPIPAPPMPEGQSGPGGGFASPAPAQNDPRAARMLQMVLQTVSTVRQIGDMVPGAIPEVRQINDLLSKVMMKVKSSQGPQEPQAPPV